jgi:glutathione reductase (NADPH)
LQAIEEYGDVDAFVANFRPLKATLSGLPDRVLMKILVCATSNKVVGVHMCGDDAPEIIQVCMTSCLLPISVSFLTGS